MGNRNEFMLLHEVDTSKINVPFRDKFAKLTLSSNKKKAAAEQTLNAKQAERRQSASRNLLQQLSGTIIDRDGKVEVTKSTVNVNPLLRSDSLSTNDPADLEETHMSDSENHSSATMEPLQVSEDYGHSVDMKAQLEKLSEKISCLNVGSPKIEMVKSEAINSEVHTAQVPMSMTENTICISSTSSEAEDDAITISDTSYEAIDQTLDYDLITSNLPQSGETDDAFLPCTFSNERADRMEAFLRDVSQQRREFAQAQTNEPMNQCEIPIVERSMREKRLLALDDTTPLSGNESLFSMESRKAYLTLQLSNIENENDGANENGNEAENSANDCKRLANNETEANTLTSCTSDLANFSASSDVRAPLANKSTVFSPVNSTLLPEDSLIIPETSSEAEDLNASTTPPRSSDEVVRSQNGTASSPGEASRQNSQLSQIQMSMGSISISAKINIKIQISQQEESDDDDDGHDDNGGNENDNNDDHGDGGDNNSGNDDNENDDSNDEHKTKNYEGAVGEVDVVQETNDSPSPHLSVSGIVSSADNCGQHIAEKTTKQTSNDSSDKENESFMNQAERLLTELYGVSWKTPEVIRTLKRTSEKDEKSSNTKKSASKTKGTRRLNILPSSTQVGEESALDDFSIFQRNIVRTNLDSTRLGTPKQRLQHTDVKSMHANTEPRRPTKNTLSKISKTNAKGDVFKMPQSECKRRLRSQQKQKVNAINERWRTIGDDENSNTEGDNASDDTDIDATDSDLLTSDESWKGDSASDDSDFEQNIKKTTKRSRKNGRATKACAAAENVGETRIRRSKDELIYLDLSKNEVTVVEGISTPPANNDVNFQSRLQDILRTCRAEDKPKLESTPRSKRKLFTANYNYEDIPSELMLLFDTPKSSVRTAKDDDTGLLSDCENIPSELIPPSFRIINKPLDAVKTGKPIFEITPPRSAGKQFSKKIQKTPNSIRANGEERSNAELFAAPNYKYGFLKSLDVCVSKSQCHPVALTYRENYRQRKEELSQILYDLYNEKVFNNELHVSVVWNKKLSITAGRCLTKKRMGNRISVIELSEKVLTSADRLRCTLIHEMCHAATWMFNGEGGHGKVWKTWARKANSIFPEIPKIGVCHQYDIEYKYTYKCVLCNAKSHAHSKSKKVENIRCSYCHGAIEIFLNKKDKDGNIVPIPVREPTGFAKFVKDNYKQYKRPDLKHADIMKLLSNEFASLKVAGNAK